MQLKMALSAAPSQVFSLHTLTHAVAVVTPAETQTTDTEARRTQQRVRGRHAEYWTEPNRMGVNVNVCLAPRATLPPPRATLSAPPLRASLATRGAGQRRAAQGSRQGQVLDEARTDDDGSTARVRLCRLPSGGRVEQRAHWARSHRAARHRRDHRKPAPAALPSPPLRLAVILCATWDEFSPREGPCLRLNAHETPHAHTRTH